MLAAANRQTSTHWLPHCDQLLVLGPKNESFPGALPTNWARFHPFRQDKHSLAADGILVHRCRRMVNTKPLAKRGRTGRWRNHKPNFFLQETHFIRTFCSLESFSLVRLCRVYPDKIRKNSSGTERNRVNSSITSPPGRCAENSRIAWERVWGGVVRTYKHGSRRAQSKAHCFWRNGTNRPAVSAAGFGPRAPRDSRGQNSRESDASVSTRMHKEPC